MPAKRPQKSAPKSGRISTGDLAALRDFCRGYLHEDLKDEYGSPQRAVEQFGHDANPVLLETVASQWHQFMSKTQGYPLTEINRVLTEELGCRWYFASTQELEKMGQAFLRFLPGHQ